MQTGEYRNGRTLLHYTFSSSSPSKGGALYNRAGVSARWMGEPESLILPAVGCSHSHTNPRAWMCGSLKAWLTVLIGPHRSEERRVGKECRSRWSPYH